MNSRLCLSQMSVGTTSTRARSMNFMVLWTLLFGVFFITPSFAKNSLNKNFSDQSCEKVASISIFSFLSVRKKIEIKPTTELVREQKKVNNPSTTNAYVNQNFTIPKDGKAVTTTIINCSVDNVFTDDGGDFYIYDDSKVRNDTIA
ncbi:MAG: hypothetical protein AAGJ18_05140, partial [Bacteroidota bacterium]